MPKRDKMENLVVHRIVEQHAVTRGDISALDQEGDSITYRELNVRANAMARQLSDAGFRRGSHLMIAMEHGIDLATVLLAVLKAGGTYTWQLPGNWRFPWSAALAAGPDESTAAYRPIDVRAMLGHPVRPSPNLPILTRPSDLACVLLSMDGRRVLVPHSTLTALQQDLEYERQVWEGDASTFDLWAGLMAGATLSVATAPALSNAA